VAQDIFASNGPTTTVAAAHGVVTAGTSETWTVASSTGFPAAVTGVSQFRVADRAHPTEIMIVTNVSGTTWTVTRGAESTAPVAHSAGFTVYQALTTGVLTALSPMTFSPMVFGAKGDGTTDDTTAVQAAVAAASAVGGTVDLGRYIFRTSSPITLPPFVTIRGSNLGSAQDNYGGVITNSASDIFTLASNVVGVLIENCGFIASAGHVFNAGTANVSSFTVDGVWINQQSPTHAIWHQVGGFYVGNSWGARKVCILNCSSASGPASVSPWQYTNGGTQDAFNNNYFGMMRAQGQAATVPFFNINMDTSVGTSEETTFDQVIFEVCNGGGISMTGAYDVQINMCANWDQTAVTANFYSFTQSAHGYPCSNIQVNGGRAGVTSASGYYDLYCDSHCYAVLVIDLLNFNGIGTLINSPASQTTLINTPASNAASPSICAPSFTPTGDSAATGSAAAARYLAATTGGPPATGTYKVGDVVPDQAGALYVCTATPRTFATVGSASGEIQPADVGCVAWTVKPTIQTVNVQWSAALNGFVLFWAFKVGVAGTIHNVNYVVGSGGGGVTMTNTYFGIFSGGATTALLLGSGTAATADQSTNMQTAGAAYSAALGTALAVTPGMYRLGLLIGSAATMPKLAGAGGVSGLSGGVLNLGITSSVNYLTSESSTGGYTALPTSSVTVGGATNIGLPVFVMN
jgi:hypothetical protein